MAICWRENMFMDMSDPRGMQLHSNLSPGANVSSLCCSQKTIAFNTIYTAVSFTHNEFILWRRNATYYRANSQLNNNVIVQLVLLI